ncbi:hypothetical protein SLS60_002471 [Paraconiothyrium brasiliense]|uniref:Uncharacterized protein n=1 Tax=Paraconiothyrium brasiliense TaxID=300254 RepID=A0ABR3S2A2_9PLEO
MTSAPPTPRGRGRRTRWERVASPPFLAPNKDDGDLSDTSVRTSSTIRPDGTVVPEDIALPKDVDIVEKSGKNGKKVDKAGEKPDDAVINDSASVSDGPTALRGFFMVFPIVLLILCAYNPECLADILGDLAVCVKDPVGCLEECIMGPK